MSMFFNYTPPRICFTESEQSMLALALTGASDRELTELLHVSIDTVKKRWEKIFERVSAMDPDVLPQGPVNRHARRGPEKRRHLLRYLNSHLEELRPYGTRPEKMHLPVGLCG
jgi:DNA-binding NarL/FixJ family response regulator